MSESATIATLEASLHKVKTQLENERHHWGHDLSSAKARHRILLRERIQPLLEDAVDAIEIDVPSVALKRVKYALKVIAENLKGDTQ